MINVQEWKMPQATILIQGQLDPRWADWFEGFHLTFTDTGETILSGDLPDQAALYGIIAKLRDMGVQLLSIKFESAPEQ